MDQSLVNDSAPMTTPAPAKGTATALVASAALAASGAYTRSSIVDLTGARRATFFVSYTAGAASGVLSIVPLFSAEGVKPAAGDDSWFAASVWDGSVTAGTLTASSLPSGTDLTVAPDFGRALHRALDLRTEPADATSDAIRIAIELDVTPYRWMQLLYAEAGATGSPGTAAIKYALSA